MNKAPVYVPDHSCSAIRRSLDRRRFLQGLGTIGILQALPMTAWAASDAISLDLSALETLYGGRLGVCATDGQRRVQWRSDERFAYCSTFKLFLAACVLQRVQEGKEQLDRTIPITADDMVAYAPVTGEAVGSSLSVAQLCKGTVQLSDNPAANILLREIGGLQAMREWYGSIGDTVTRVDRYETELNTALPDDPRDTTTPAQYVADMQAVLGGKVLAATQRAQLEEWLLGTPTGAGRIKAALPAGYRLGHKTGTGDRNTHNDIGVIWAPDGRAIYIVTYFTDAGGGSDEQRDAVLAQAARLSLKHLGHA